MYAGVLTTSAAVATAGKSHGSGRSGSAGATAGKSVRKSAQPTTSLARKDRGRECCEAPSGRATAAMEIARIIARYTGTATWIDIVRGLHIAARHHQQRPSPRAIPSWATTATLSPVRS